MEKKDIIDKVRTILVTILKHENLSMKDEMTAAEVDGWDSLTHMIIITEIEKIFQIKFKLKELNRISNLGGLIELIRSKSS